ncbi:hypothetical protein TNCT_438761 [Trichonephila clavata]|uniref:Reverse transcriptase domain-containing protein n=1 Tax=Trichonephila clavata TaxID=2740835 RepID=A0A8X6IGK6_TRICU|nr:hypothetical protein TNCT_438761 [Trichonephila clavata]
MSPGMPQGVVLSCLLFMIDDLKTAIQKVPGVSYLFLADDVVIWATSSNIRSLEEALNSPYLILQHGPIPTKWKSVLRRQFPNSSLCLSSNIFSTWNTKDFS